MKKLLLFALLLIGIATRNAQAQNAKVTINNHTDYKVRIIMYGYAPTSCGTDCSNTYITNVIAVDEPNAPAYPTGTRTWGPNTPCAIAGGVGWNVDICAPTPWCSALPADFMWTLAEIDVLLAGGWGSFPVFLSPGQFFCTGAPNYWGPYTDGVHFMDFTWTGSAGAWEDATITINQY